MKAIETREALHAIAEHVLAPARYAATGHVGLRATPGGFGTPPFPNGSTERQLLVRDATLVDRNGDDERRTRLTTLGELGDFVGIAPGVPEGVYEPATPLEVDRLLAVDADCEAQLAEWFALGNE